MRRSASEGPTGSGPAAWLQGLWAYYREYTHTAIHTASAAALTAFGLLVFVDPLFVLLAIASYVCPPIVLYVLDAEVGKPDGESADAEHAEVARDRREGAPRETEGGVKSADDTDSDTGDSDSDSDSDDGDTDSDSDS
ncbi:hypothetical protein [Halorientalis halophila]|uniref:hypothetical protein n=1 Tax=Halorientalis halophila TaxID=3108499 RepID=UPI00300A186B